MFKPPLWKAFAVLFAVLLCTGASPVFAQCADPSCAGGNDGRGPDIGITPFGPETFTIVSGGTQTVPFKVALSDSDGLNQASLKILLIGPTVTSTVTGYSYTPNAAGTYSLVQGSVQLRTAGKYTLEVTAADRVGNPSTAKTEYYLTVTTTDINTPVVTQTTSAPHHNGYRNTSLGAAVMRYSMPSYTSMDVERATELYYDSEQADPSGFVQFDVDTGLATSGSRVKAVTLQIVDAATGQAVTSEDAWAKDPSGKQRIGARWPMRDRASGAYMFYGDVRSYLDDNTTRLTRISFRVLVINQAQSRYGGGWSLGGIQRIHSTAPTTEAGVVLNEGTGIARWFARNGNCTAAECRYFTPAGDFTQLIYNLTAGQWERTYPNGTKVVFNSAGVQKSAADRFGRVTTYDWVSVDTPVVWLLTKITDPAGKVTSLNYNGGLLSEIVDPAGRRATLTYQAGTTAFHLIRAAGPVTLDASYDSATNRVTSYTDWHGTWDLEYDDFGTVRKLIQPWVIASGQNVRPAITYRSIQSLVSLKSWVTHICCNWAAPVPLNAVHTTVADPLGHTTKMALDRYGNVTQVIDSLGRTRNSTWTPEGLPESVNNGVQTVVYSWNSRGQVLSMAVNGSVVYQASYTLSDLPDYEVHNGEQRWYAYGDRGQILMAWTGAHGDSYRTATTFQYDANYRMIASTGPSGERSEWSYANTWQNVSEARMIREDGVAVTQRLTYDEAGRAKTAQDPFGYTTTVTYDLLNRSVLISDTLQKTVATAYTGPHVTRVTDQAGKAWTFKYNALGWLLEEGFPEDGKKRTYSYNLDGQVISHTDRRGLTVNATYDFAHRLSTQTADNETSTFSYPDANTAIAANKETTETMRSHARAGGVELVKMTIGPGTASRHYEIQTIFDETTWATKGIDIRQYLNGSVVQTSSIRQTFDSRPVDTTLGSTLAIQDTTGRTTTLGFDTSGRHVRTTFPFPVTHNRYYTKDGRLMATTFGSNTILNRDLGVSYDYDLVNRMTARYTKAGTLLWSYEYDYRSQLTAYRNAQKTTPLGCTSDPSTGEPDPCEPVWASASAESYAYDSTGNRTDRNATLVPSSNRYKTFDGFTFEYDAEGNITRKSKAGYEQTLTWNALGQLASVTTNGVRVDYGYSPMGRRFRRTQGGQNQYFVYHGGNLLLELDANGSPLQAYTHAPGVDYPLAVQNVPAGPSAVHYFIMDDPGHVSGLLNTSGGIAAQYRYGPFGRMEASFNGVQQSLKFMGRELDATTGLYYVRARWYDPASARFISSDPIGLEGGLNTYAYVGNNPMNGRDPSGLQQQPTDCSQPNACLDPITVCVTSTGMPCDAPWWERVGNWFKSLEEDLRGRRAEDEFGGGQMRGWSMSPTRARLEAERRAARRTAADVGAAFSSGYALLGEGGALGLQGLSVAATAYGDAWTNTVRLVKHHIFPVELKARFLKAGVRVNSHTMELIETLHKEIHRGPGGGPWNQAWHEFFAANPEATAADVYQKGQEMIEEFGLWGRMREYNFRW
jgi:RHS repeat-associated protein